MPKKMHQPIMSNDNHTWKQPNRESSGIRPGPFSLKRRQKQFGEVSRHDLYNLAVKEPSSPEDNKQVVACDKLKHKLLFLSDMIAGADVIFVVLAASTLTIMVNTINHENAWMSYLSESKAAVATLGAFYSFAMVF